MFGNNSIKLCLILHKNDELLRSKLLIKGQLLGYYSI